jgi:hypothetical protein
LGRNGHHPVGYTRSDSEQSEDWLKRQIIHRQSPARPLAGIEFNFATVYPLASNVRETINTSNNVPGNIHVGRAMDMTEAVLAVRLSLTALISWRRQSLE